MYIEYCNCNKTPVKLSKIVTCKLCNLPILVKINEVSLKNNTDETITISIFLDDKAKIRNSTSSYFTSVSEGRKLYKKYIAEGYFLVNQIKATHLVTYRIANSVTEAIISGTDTTGNTRNNFEIIGFSCNFKKLAKIISDKIGNKLEIVRA